MSKNTKTLTETKNISGLLRLTLEHEVKSTKYEFEWNGPKIPAEEWHKILAFFKWTYETTKSESQVRLYVNCRPEVRTWKAWAFPQKANTGITAQEMDTPETAIQRAQFSDADGWLYFGTVHHHCAMSAFQSGTDRNNEQGQDGLHITVGHVDKPHHDIHARLYIGGRELTPDLSDFWGLGDMVSSLPHWVCGLLPKGTPHKLALFHMGETCATDCAFPDEWQANLIAPAPTPISVTVNNYTSGGGYFPASTGRHFRKASYLQRSKNKLPFDLGRATDEIEGWIERANEEKNQDAALAHQLDWKLEDVVQACYDISGKLHDYEMELMDILCRNDVLPEDWMKHVERLIERREEKAMEQEAAEEAAAKQEAEGGKVAIGDQYHADQKAIEDMYNERGW
jgi:hypothetical protein